MKTKIILLAIAIAAVGVTGSMMGKGGNESGGIMLYSMIKPVDPSITTLVTQGSNIEVSFGSSAGIVNTTIRNSIGQKCYRQRVDTSVQNSLQINIANYPTGTYTLAFSDAKGAIIKTEQFVVD